MKVFNPQQDSSLSSPANLLIAGLVVLLLAGYGTDWKILFGNSTKPKPPARFGATEMAVGAHRTRQLRQGFTPAAESNAEVADNGSPTTDR